MQKLAYCWDENRKRREPLGMGYCIESLHSVVAKIRLSDPKDGHTYLQNGFQHGKGRAEKGALAEEWAMDCSDKAACSNGGWWSNHKQTLWGVSNLPSPYLQLLPPKTIHLPALPVVKTAVRNSKGICWARYSPFSNAKKVAFWRVSFNCIGYQSLSLGRICKAGGLMQEGASKWDWMWP